MNFQGQRFAVLHRQKYKPGFSVVAAVGWSGHCAGVVGTAHVWRLLKRTNVYRTIVLPTTLCFFVTKVLENLKVGIAFTFIMMCDNSFKIMTYLTGGASD